MGDVVEDAGELVEVGLRGKNSPGGGGGANIFEGLGPPELEPCIIIMARAFSAAAAAAIKLLFSASLNNGERNKKDGSIPGGNEE